MPYTRIEVKSAVRLMLAEVIGTLGAGEEFLLDQAITDATDEVARTSHSFYTDKITKIEGTPQSPQSRFCMPDLYRIVSVTIKNPDDSHKILKQKTLRRMDATLPGWREDPQGGAAEVWVYASPWVYVYPGLTYVMDDGIVFSGYGTPGAMWDGDDDPFPLADRCFQAVVLRTACTRCIQFPTPENMARYPMLEARFQQALAQIGSEETTQRDSGRSSGVSLL